MALCYRGFSSNGNISDSSLASRLTVAYPIGCSFCRLPVLAPNLASDQQHARLKSDRDPDVTQTCRYERRRLTTTACQGWNLGGTASWSALHTAASLLLWSFCLLGEVIGPGLIMVMTMYHEIGFSRRIATPCLVCRCGSQFAVRKNQRSSLRPEGGMEGVNDCLVRRISQATVVPFRSGCFPILHSYIIN